MVSGSSLGLEFHDSVLQSVSQEGQACLIALRPAYVYEVNVGSGEAHTCMKQDAIFEFNDGRIAGTFGDLPAPILDGSLAVDSQVVDGLLPVPFDRDGVITLKLFMWPDYREIIVSARSVAVYLEGDAVPERMPSS